MRGKEVQHKQECWGRCEDTDNEPPSMLIRSRRVESSRAVPPSFFHREHLGILNERQRINSKNIWTIYSNTLWSVPEAGGQRAVVENGQWRDGKDSQAVHCFFFSSFFVMGCQNGFDLLRDLLIINCIICFLLHSGQEKQTPTHHQRPGQISYHQRGWLDRSWRFRLSADGG